MKKKTEVYLIKENGYLDSGDPLVFSSEAKVLAHVQELNPRAKNLRFKRDTNGYSFMVYNHNSPMFWIGSTDLLIIELDAPLWREVFQV